MVRYSWGVEIMEAPMTTAEEMTREVERMERAGRPIAEIAAYVNRAIEKDNEDAFARLRMEKMVREAVA